MLPANLLHDTPTFSTNLLFETGRSLPNAVGYLVRRFSRPAAWSGEESAQVRYHCEGDSTRNYLELRYCLLGHVYCKKFRHECSQCKAAQSEACESRMDSVDVVSLSLSPAALQPLASERAKSFSERLLRFQEPVSFTRSIALCAKTRQLLEGLLNHTYTESREAIFVNAQTQLLLLSTLDSLDETEPVFAGCKFLHNEPDRDKVVKARDLLLQHLGEPLTIKQLSRKVAMNECYLKKGFKEMFGATIFEFYQEQRMQHARNLLYEKGLSVTEVADLLGYSSISHFSTAFKKHTGLKPCELLLR